MRDITVDQLREMLDGLDGDTIIRVAEQPSWPLQLAIWDEVRRVGDVAYLRISEHPNDASPYAPKAAFGDYDVVESDAVCMMCDAPTSCVVDDPDPDEDVQPICLPCAARHGVDVVERDALSA